MTFASIFTEANIITFSGYLSTLFAIIVAVYKARATKATAAQTMLVIINTLKDEAKMPEGTFSPATIEKAERVAMTIGADDVAIEQVKEVLKGKEMDLKLASLKGKPIYLSDVLKFGNLFKNLRGMFK